MGAKQSSEVNEGETMDHSYLKIKEEEYQLYKNILMEARFHFTFKCLDKIKQMNPQENIVFSPYGLYDALLLAYFASSGIKEIFLKHILFLSNVSKNKLIEYYAKERSLNLQIKPDCGVNSNCWMKNANECEKFKALHDIFSDDIKSLKLCDYPVSDSVNRTMRDTADKIIRDTDIYNGYIPFCNIDVVDLTNKFTEVILTTALDFKEGFDMLEEYERIPLFWNKRNIPTFDNRNCKAYESYDLDVSAVEFIYNNQTSLFVLVPTYYMRKFNINPLLHYKADFDINEHMSNMIKNISSESGVSHLRKLLNGELENKPSLVKNKFAGINPIFELEKDLPLKDLLKELIQDTGLDMKGFMSSNNKNCHLGYAAHRTHIRIAPDYTEASAITAIFDGNEHHDRPDDHNLWEPNRPFVWLIYDKKCQTVSFAGICNKPVKSFYSKPSKIIFDKRESYNWEIEDELNFKNVKQM